jgi:hypothetical protein
MIVTPQEFEEWKQHSVTKQFFKNLLQVRESIKEALVLRQYEDDEFAKGKAMVLLELSQMEYEDFKEGMK